MPGDRPVVDEWLSVAQLAAELDVSEASIMERIDEWPHFSLGPQAIRFRRSEIAGVIAKLAASRDTDAFSAATQKAMDDWVKKQLAKAPPLTAEQAALIRRLLGRSGRPAGFSGRAPRSGPNRVTVRAGSATVRA